MSEAIEGAAIPESAAPTPEAVPVQPTGNGAATPSWRDSLSIDLQTNETLSQIPDIETLAKNHVNVQKLIGVDKIPRPQEDWDEDQYNDFYTKLGRPAAVEDYDFSALEIPEGATEDTDYQTAMVAAAHSLGLSQNQVLGLLQAQYEFMGGRGQQGAADAESDQSAADQELRNEWGKGYDAKIDMAQRALVAGAGGDKSILELPMEGGLKLGSHPAVVRIFANLGDQLSEHGLVGGGQPRTTLSPGEAQAQIDKMLGDTDMMKILMNKSHPEYKLMVQKKNALYEQLNLTEEL